VIIKTAFEEPDSKPNRTNARGNERTDEDSFDRAHFHVSWGTYSEIGNDTRIGKKKLRKTCIGSEANMHK